MTITDIIEQIHNLCILINGKLIRVQLARLPHVLHLQQVLIAHIKMVPVCDGNPHVYGLQIVLKFKVEKVCGQRRRLQQKGVDHCIQVVRSERPVSHDVVLSFERLQ